MAGETVITTIGNLTADPELRWTNNGIAVASFTVASTPRVWDRKQNQMVDGEPLFLRCTVWRDVAEQVSQSLAKGMRVIVTGTLKQKNYEVEGHRRTSYELDVDEVGPSLRWATAQVTRVQRQDGGQGASSEGFAGGSSSQGGNAPQNDGWAQPGQAFDNEAPF